MWLGTGQSILLGSRTRWGLHRIMARPGHSVSLRGKILRGLKSCIEVPNV